MIKQFLAASAFAALMSTTALAQTAPAPAPAEPAAPAPSEPAKPVAAADGFLASAIIGEGVYNGTADNAEDIGKVTDIVLDKDGKIKSLIVGVGGFLGVGQKDVEMPYADAQWVEKNGDRWIAIPMTKEAMEAAPAFDKAPYMPVVSTTAQPVAPSPTTTTPPATTTPTEPKLETAPAPAAPAPAEQAPANPAPTTGAPAPQ